mgnify:CR=1 FL=1
MHADPRAGDDALRLRRRARRRAHRPRLGRGAPARPRRAHLRRRASRTSSTRSRASARCAGCSRRRRTRASSRRQDFAGATIATELVQVTRNYFEKLEASPVKRVEFSWGATEVEAAGARRRDRRGHRNRIDAARQPPAHHRHACIGVEHAADRQPDGAGRSVEEAPRSTTSRCCCARPSRRRAASG